MSRPSTSSFIEAKTWMPGTRLRQGFAGLKYQSAEALAKAGTRPGMTKERSANG
jgi:hypothetical protein